jgi:hypothetical protein
MSVVEKDLFREVSTFKTVCDYIEDHGISLLTATAVSNRPAPTALQHTGRPVWVAHLLIGISRHHFIGRSGLGDIITSAVELDKCIIFKTI